MIFLATFCRYSRENIRTSSAHLATRFLTILVLLATVLPSAVAEGQGRSSSSRKSPRERISPEVKHAARSITGRECLEHVVWLADDLREGRLAGSRGSRDSADYIQKSFEMNGLLPGGDDGTWFQNFSIPGRTGIRGTLEKSNRVRFQVSENAIGMQSLEYGTEFLPHPRSPDADLSAMCAYLLEPLQTPAQLERDPIKQHIAVMPGDESVSEEVLAATCTDIANRGGVALFLVGEAYRAGPSEVWPPADVQELLPIPVVRVYGAGIQKLWKISGRPARSWKRQSTDDGAVRMGRPHVTLEVSRAGRDLSLGRNVIGRLLGTDPQLRAEYVVIGAHYDHLGNGLMSGRYPEGSKGEIHNGADDNASGVAGLLELVEAYALNRLRPKRTLIFVAFDAEEMGLHGSNAFVAQGGYPIESIRGMVNLDMIARNDPRVVKVGRRASDESLGEIIQMMARALKLTIDETGMESFLDRSDQAPFLRAGIPAVFFFGGLHDDYHTANDDVKYVSPVKMENIGRLAFLTAWGLLQQTIESDDAEPGNSD